MPVAATADVLRPFAGLPCAEDLRAAPVRLPRPSALAAPLQVKGRKAAEALEALGLRSVGDLLEHLPRDSRETRAVGALQPGEQATVTVEVVSISSRPVRRRGMRPLVEAVVADGTGRMRATFFNQPWLLQRYPAGTRLLLHGTAQAGRRFRVSNHALAGGDATAPAPPGSPGDSTAVGHYAVTAGITSTELMSLVAAARPALAHVVEPLPAALRVAEALPDRPAALDAMHFPRTPAERERARERLAFEELLVMQLRFLRRRAGREERSGAPALDQPPTLSARWRDGLPFALTDDQLAAVAVIDADLARVRPMQRLLMGEVGSGKTVVALHAMLRAVEHGRQAALMAPTETLAEQHFATVQRLMAAEPVPCALLTGSTPARRRADVLAKLASGELALVVGTHALIEPSVRFRDLALAVVDEQHRFGVRQREALEGDGDPHVLHMTATPIPRTLALHRYGDLDVTELRGLPHGRSPVKTRIVTGDSARARAYELLRSELLAGRQAYVICPLVEQEDEPASGMEDARAATDELERLRAGELRSFRLALLHGQMRPREKQAAMAAFAAGEADVLVATTVVEVGVDVPNATVILVENAERFGISQLHQLRGRVGRGEHPSTCLLCGPGGSERLRALASTGDGFRLAEIDLRLRREGDLLGTRQSGFARFRVASLPEDDALLLRARARAEAIVAQDPQLRAPEHALLAPVVQRDVDAPIPA